MIEKSFHAWKKRARRFFELDFIDLFMENKLILQAPTPLYYANDTATTVAMYPVVGDIADYQTVTMPAITRQLPKTPSGNLM